MPGLVALTCAAAVCAILGTAGMVAAQSNDAAPQTRPRIGLALGGGSAQVGVLEWFEEHHIPIDCIVGTSMGGLVAGAYASGMTPAEIRELMRSRDCGEVIRSTI